MCFIFRCSLLRGAWSGKWKEVEGKGHRLAWETVYVRPALPSRQVDGLVVAVATHGAAHTRTRLPPGSPVGLPELDQKPQLAYVPLAYV